MTTSKVLGAEDDHGDVLVLKSGTDFRDLSEITLEIGATSPGSVRAKVIRRITGKRRLRVSGFAFLKQIPGKRHSVSPGSRSSESLKKLLATLLSGISLTLKAPVCKTTVMIDVRSQFIRTAESAVGNWIADIIRHAYDDALCMKGCGGSDGVFICAGTLRGDSTYGPGAVTLGDILEILPFEDPLVVIELDGATIWEALESSLATWPAQEGRFPIISGFRVSWDSRRRPGERVLGVWLVREKEVSDDGEENGMSTPRLFDLEPIQRENEVRKYNIVTREYLAEGHDGYITFKGKKHLIDHEGGNLMSAIVRRYFLGSQFINKMAAVADRGRFAHLHSSTQITVSREKAKRLVRDRNQPQSSIVHRWKHAAEMARRWSRSRTHYQEQLNVCTMEHMSVVDPFDGSNTRKGKGTGMRPEAVEDEDLLTVRPEVDGRLRNEFKV